MWVCSGCSSQLNQQGVCMNCGLQHTQQTAVWIQPQQGQPVQHLQKAEKLIDKAWFAWILLFIFFPVGLYLLYRQYLNNRKATTLFGACLGAVLSVFILGFFIGEFASSYETQLDGIYTTEAIAQTKEPPEQTSGAVLESKPDATHSSELKTPPVPKSTSTPAPKQEPDVVVENNVYWTPSGEVYHLTPDCPTLLRSKTIYEGIIKQSGKPRACEKCG